ncbi:tRNA (adenosine(37)-N6)-threonylcarbamoyltransferase complex dimerization subunit type 1 TsaB [Streptococcus sp. DD12]|uniref:tRNA (adenosine(37)-N6)-threonylcarbamoyltransferase complex dimerization subunit type 1 TsaB n=1 Tax=Streptococcus sp. DD12 TaxID=1777880 RepID=UPI000795B729|nr:tRNA (adenosine(37)-N6)-threonylcarbamoyltransferase complex dimerization subunit type 1 TsaB [Streptococcus sp. DD12]KXT75559.1 Inactive metal-dependent protease, putative molecular chaperone [Streptococcus sp. DD12]
MLSLALDTSNQSLSVALLDGEKLLGQVLVTIKKNHSITLMPTIDYLVRTCDVSKSAIERIIVAQGPGSYTGLRIAVVTAKTLAMALNCDLVGVSSLFALTDKTVSGIQIPLINARRHAVYAGIYQEDMPVQADAYQDFSELLAVASQYEQVTFVGEVAAFAEEIKKSLPQAQVLETQPDAYRLGLLGQTLPAVAVHDFVPSYLKAVEAEEKWQETHPTDETKDWIARI